MKATTKPAAKSWFQVALLGLWIAVCLAACAAPESSVSPARSSARHSSTARRPIVGAKRGAANLKATRNVPGPVCSRAARFLREDYPLLAKRYGTRSYPLGESLQDSIFQFTPQMWERIQYHWIKYFHGKRLVQFGGINIVMPSGWNIGLHPQNATEATCQVDTLPGESPGNPFPITFQMQIEVPTVALRCCETKGVPRRTGSVRSESRKQTLPSTEPDLVRAIGWANSTPTDFFALLGSRTTNPQDWQTRLFERIFHKLDKKEYDLGSAIDCFFNGHVYALIGISPRHKKGELANISLFGPNGAFRGRIYIHYWYLTGSLAYARALKRSENLVRGISLSLPPRRIDEQKKAPAKIKPSQIPLLIATDIALNRELADFRAVQKMEQLRLGNRLIRLNRQMGSNGAPLDFVIRTWFLESSDRGNTAGYPSVAVGRTAFSKHALDGGCYVFITSPIKSFGNRVLVIRSKPGDYDTTIVSVDRFLKVSPLYDSLDIPQPASLKQPEVGVGPVYRMAVAKPDVFYLYETAEEGLSLKNVGAFVSHPNARVFVIDFPDGHFRIRLRSRGSR